MRGDGVWLLATGTRVPAWTLAESLSYDNRPPAVKEGADMAFRLEQRGPGGGAGEWSMAGRYSVIDARTPVAARAVSSARAHQIS
jgi:hypothetical protein